MGSVASTITLTSYRIASFICLPLSIVVSLSLPAFIPTPFFTFFPNCILCHFVTVLLSFPYRDFLLPYVCVLTDECIPLAQCR